MSAEAFSDVVERLGARLDEFEDLTLPVYVLDANGIVVWMNRSARELFGDRLNHHFREFLPADFRPPALEHFVRKMIGSETSANYESDVIDRSGRRRGVSLNTVTLSDGYHAVGVFGIVDAVSSPHAPAIPGVKLSPRQHEVLRHLEAGSATREIAERLGVSVETVRNHIRAVLRALGVHSRLEAVAEAKRRRSGK
ncbi:MAG TPA: LuxR C-terminal-related transcriptional regulator [Gaiellaceae bacterium]|nr:LuxR C-terminal-related transcriptional regulator [Gaiellaceae bacterium]